MPIVLTVIAVLLAIWGILQILAGDILWGLLLLVLACVVGPGGYSVFDRRR